MNDCPPNIRLFLLLNFHMKNSNKSIVLHCVYVCIRNICSCHTGCFGQEEHPSSSSLILSVCTCQMVPFYIIIDEMVNEQKKNSFKCVYELNSFEWLIDSNGWMLDIFDASWIFQRVSIQSYQNFITNGLGHFSKHFQQQQQRQPECRSIAMRIVLDFANNVDLNHLGAFYLL